MAAVNRLLALACAGGLALALGGCREEEAPAAFDTGIAFSQAESLPGFQKLEWLPFHNMCLEKYQQLGLPFPLEGTPALEDQDLAHLLAAL